MKKLLFFILLVIASCAYAALSPLPADKAFIFSAYLDKNNQLVFEWDIAPGYYLYRNELNFTPSDTSDVKIGEIDMPQGEARHDMLHGDFQAYTGSIKVPVLLKEPIKGILKLDVKYQGCSSGGFCYTPIRKSLSIDLSEIAAPKSLNEFIQSATATSSSEATMSTKSALDNLIEGHNLLLTMLSFLGIGLLLAFTPCVLPMIPILSGIILGSGKHTDKRRAFFLSLVYVSGMAITYAIVGVVIALIGSSVQAQLERPWIIILFSCMFVLLALSLFGLYEIEIPTRWQHMVTSISNKQKAGTYLGVFLMGVLSTLIVSPCVSAPLVGVLAYIGQTGDVVLGGLALLSLGIGMGIPLLLIGVSADKLIPKAGAWMLTVERVFGLVMLGVAIWMLSRMIPGPVTLLLWSLLAFGATIYLFVYAEVPIKFRWITQGAGVVFFIYAIILFIGAAAKNSDPLNPWAELGHYATNQVRAHMPLPSITVHSIDELDQQLGDAKTAKQPVMLDFTAKWCTACVVMDKKIFSRTDVRTALKDFVILRADVTDDDDFSQAILKRFQVIGPPTIIFFGSNGDELKVARIVGEVGAKEFLANLKEVN